VSTSGIVDVIPETTPADRSPLVVDVDGSLVRTNLLWEGMARLLLRRPWQLGGAFSALLRGKAALKAYVANRATLDLETVPLEPSVVHLIQDTIAAGRPVILASGSHEAQVAVIGSRLGVTATYGSDGATNLTGQRKLTKVLTGCDRFDYVGNDTADLPLWSRAARAFAVNAGPITLWRARRRRPDLVVLPHARAPLTVWARALRTHQWTKNILLVLPAVAAHLPWGWGLLRTIVTGFLAFSLVASAVYLVNDLFDLQEDRRHPTKRRRPLAEGDLGIPGALAAVVALLATATILAAPLPRRFQLCLLAYLLLATAYCALLKRYAVADVLTLATMYALRVVAGAVLVVVPLSRWFLAFSVFFFLSLALIKRVVELQKRADRDTSSLPGRGYRVQDVPVLIGLGLGATAVSSLVYCLYITSEDIVRYYSRPDFLWVGLLLLLYWQARVWLIAGRNEMTEDPVVFALRDRVSRVVFATFMLAVVLASR
jgi:4-hydroxybenzoate polyprenyltransferase/phosphoserine phosphatase